MSGKIAASGNCNAIWNYQDLNAPLKKYCGCWMFNNCNLTITPELPATMLAEGCYNYMFFACIFLTTAPELPATTLAKSCYSNMFLRCDKLTTAPKILPATTLTDYCYSQMFLECPSLTTAPELPAITLANCCYYEMFKKCTSLTTAPEILPATTLADWCYSYMFSGCTSLTKSPELPATTLARSCYIYMFQNCTSLTTAPELPATELAEYCYREMFSGCTSLNHITCLATDISDSNCTYNWVEGVASTGTFIKHPDMNDWTTGSAGIPSGWIVRDKENSMNPNEPIGEYNLVDLGLSVKWADRNVGAETPQDSGLYFSWGNVEGHTVDENGNVIDGYLFDYTQYSTTPGGQYTGGILDAEHDAATANMGSGWRMPTKAEAAELVENTDQYYIDEDGSIVDKSNLDGSTLRSICFVKKGEVFDYDSRSNFIEFPFAGNCEWDSKLSYKGLIGYVWTSYINNDYSGGALNLYFNSSGNIYGGSANESRYCGQSVRGVHA